MYLGKARNDTFGRRLSVTVLQVATMGAFGAIMAYALAGWVG